MHTEPTPEDLKEFTQNAPVSQAVNVNFTTSDQKEGPANITIKPELSKNNRTIETNYEVKPGHEQLYFMKRNGSKKRNAIDQQQTVKYVKPFVLDCTKISKKVPGLGKSNIEYNGLGDKHLRHFFQRDRTVKDLQKNGLIVQERNIVPTFEYQKLKYKIKQARKKQGIRRSRQKINLKET